ncbi:MAG TPA: hypothetical protein VF733_06875 [Candidatus Saccharimonadales bacterium]
MISTREFIHPAALSSAFEDATEILVPKGRWQEDYLGLLKLAGVDILWLDDIGGVAHDYVNKHNLRVTIQRDEAIPWCVDNIEGVVGFGCHHHYEAYRYNHPDTNIHYRPLGHVEGARFALAAHRGRVDATKQIWQDGGVIVIGTENEGMAHTLFSSRQFKPICQALPPGSVELGGRALAGLDAVLLIKQWGATSDHHQLEVFEDDLSPIFHNFYWRE